uniref:Uncharacterized protein n=1 Tax=Glossina pallidipes TaxID=7398 RepID=A0A1A9ZMD3_GLOPL
MVSSERFLLEEIVNRSGEEGEGKCLRMFDLKVETCDTIYHVLGFPARKWAKYWEHSNVAITSLVRTLSPYNLPSTKDPSGSPYNNAIVDDIEKLGNKQKEMVGAAPIDNTVV